MINRKNKRNIRHKRVRAKITGIAKVPRLYIFKSNKHIYGYLIDDEKGKTIVGVKDSELKLKGKKKSDIAKELGKLIAKKAKDLPVDRRVEKVVFDRAGYKYHGRVKSFAEGAREGGLKF